LKPATVHLDAIDGAALTAASHWLGCAALLTHAVITANYPYMRSVFMLVRKLSITAVALFVTTTLMGCEAPPPEPSSKTASPSETPKPPPSSTPTAPAAQPAKPIAPALLAPEKATETAPASFKVKFDTTQGQFVVEVTRAWAPKGADRFYNLVKIGYFEDIAVFRVIDGFMAQFGIHGEPKVNSAWRNARIDDDPVKESNKRGYLTFATSGANSRTVQMFINFGDNSRLDSQGFSPFGKVITGMDVVDKLYKGYGEGAPVGDGPEQGRLQFQGNSYLKSSFPKLDYIKTATLTP
jgi:peptidyl-prolyl cis-trans isomerase A (cyclophilin A)